MDLTDVPWRRPRPRHVPGLPAWGMPAATDLTHALRSNLFGGVGPAWALDDADGSGVRVCVLDSGVDEHPLVGPIDQAWEVVTQEGRVPRVRPCEPGDDAGHGTACAGIIRQLAPGVSLSSMKVLAGGRSGSAAALLAGLHHAVEEGFDVINMSLSTARPEYRGRLSELCDRAYFRRCTLVVAAHNLPIESFPWNFASVISVASHAEPDPMRFYYNPAPPVEFCARGVRVPVATPGGGTMRNSGNSFAAPHIAGIAALALSKHPWLTPFQLKSVLYHCAANVSTQGDDDEVRVEQQH